MNVTTQALLAKIGFMQLKIEHLEAELERAKQTASNEEDKGSPEEEPKPVAAVAEDK